MRKRHCLASLVIERIRAEKEAQEANAFQKEAKKKREDQIAQLRLRAAGPGGETALTDDEKRLLTEANAERLKLIRLKLNAASNEEEDEEEEEGEALTPEERQILDQANEMERKEKESKSAEEAARKAREEAAKSSLGAKPSIVAVKRFGAPKAGGGGGESQLKPNMYFQWPIACG